MLVSDSSLSPLTRDDVPALERLATKWDRDRFVGSVLARLVRRLTDQLLTEGDTTVIEVPSGRVTVTGPSLTPEQADAIRAALGTSGAVE